MMLLRACWSLSTAVALLMAAPPATVAQPTAAAARHSPHGWRRRAVVCTGTALGLLVPAAHSLASEYQDLASVQAAQFKAAEEARTARRLLDAASSREFEARVGALERSFRADEFVASCDGLALYVIGQGRIPEGVQLGLAVGRIRATYNLLPRFEVPCEGSKRCFTHGSAVEGAYSALLRELRRYARKGLDVQMSGGTELPNFPGGATF